MDQLSAMDASFLYIESAQMPQHVLGVMLLDAGAADSQFSFERFRKTLDERIHLMPAFQRRLVDVPLNLDHPYWVHDHDVVLDEHLQRIEIPEPGDMRTLGLLVGEIAAQRLDRDRPLFEMTIVEGMADGKVALVAKMHHSTIYGSAGADMMAQLLDFGPEGREVEAAVELPEEAVPGSLSLLAKAGLNAVRRPVRAAKAVANSTKRAGAMGGMVARSVTKKSPVTLPFSAPRSLVNGQLTSSREIAFARVPFADVKEIKAAFDTKVNDVVLSAVTFALRRYLLAHDALPTKQLVASVPMAVGAGDVAGTDKLSALLVPLPIHEDDPVAQLEQVAEYSRNSKGAADALGLDTVGEVAEFIPPLLVVQGARLYDRVGLSRLHPPMQSLIVSNMPGPPIPLYCAGARVDAVYPFGPLLPGTGLNVTVLSNMGNLDVGILACPDLVPGVWDIADAFPEAIETLLTAARKK